MTKRTYFGTDGVRGRVGEEPLTADFALRLANAAARVLTPDGGTALIGKDTRLSGYLFESALEAGFVSAGVNVLLVGPLPTPGIAFMTRKFNCDFGVVISASHNPYDDNGIKFFDRNGEKLSDELEAKIEALLETRTVTKESTGLGRLKRIDKERTEYQEYCASTMPKGVDLSGLKLVVDCANGAGYKVTPRIIADLGAEVVPVGTAPNGRNINDGCGATDPKLMSLLVPGVGAHAGIALDGDGDRLIMADENGAIIDGDHLLYVLAKAKKEAGTLKRPVVGTVMCNLGLEQALQKEDIEFRRATVGDRYVLAMLQETGGNLGGETSGHILDLDKAMIGDATINALSVLSVMRQTGKKLSELVAGMEKYPQMMLNVKVAQKFDTDASGPLQKKLKEVETALAGTGRVVLRASGTEPVIRVMVEARSAEEAEKYAQVLAEEVERTGG